MNLRKISIEPAPVLATAAIKKALRIQHALEDDVVERKFRAAIELIEERTGRVLRETSFELELDAWPCAETLLPVYPVRDVTAVSYVGAAGGGAVAVAGDQFDWRRLEEATELYFFSSWGAPALSADKRGPIVVEFEAGYDLPGAEADDPELAFPDRVLELALMLTGHWFEHREATTSGPLAEVPFSAGLLFKELRIFR